MKPDIQTHDDVKLLLDTFYTQLLTDTEVGYIFTDIAKINMQEHMPRLYAFWNTVLFAEAGYKGNPIMAHINLDKKEKLTDEHFARWMKIFFETIDKLFEGPKAEFAKEKAKAMEYLMKMKIEESRKPNFIQ